MADGDGRFPVAPDTTRPGSFLGGTPGAIFTKCFYQVRTWQIRLTASLLCRHEALSTPVEVMPAGTAVVVDAGFHHLLVTGAYADENDIWQGFRPSANEEQNGSDPLYAFMEFREPLFYTLDEPGMDGVGRFDSRVFFTDATEDVIEVLGTPEGETSPSSDILTIATSLVLEVELDGVVIRTVPLFRNVDGGADAEWSIAGRIIVEPIPTAGFWPWPVNGSPTYDVDTGEELVAGGHLLPDANGFPRAFAATNMIP